MPMSWLRDFPETIERELMRFVLFYHSLVSDWNHGNAHFLRGIVRELLARGHRVRVFEPADGWSRASLIADQGEMAIRRFQDAFPGMTSMPYDLASLDLDEALDGADVVIAHEWNEPDLIRLLGRRRARGGRFRLLFHDTHHRTVTAPGAMAGYDLSAFDGVLAFGAVIRDLYLRNGWARQAWTWHEAADAALFRPLPVERPSGDLVWIGNWGDDERAEELAEFLLRPVQALGLTALVHGVRYPLEARRALARAGIAYQGWLPNHEAPAVFARHRVTVHVPRRPYAAALPGIPTIRVFEALACGIPLVSAPWSDDEGLFRAGRDFLVARNGSDMAAHLRAVLNEPDLAADLIRNGRETILARHTCAHRVDELLTLCRQLGVSGPADTSVSAEVG